MTPAQKRAYFNTQGNFCPFCYGDNLDKEVTGLYGGEIEVTTVCQVCEQRWIEQYTIQAIKAEQVD